MVLKTVFHCNIFIKFRVGRANWFCCYSIEFLLLQSGSEGQCGSQSAGLLEMKYMSSCVSYTASVTERTGLLL